MRYIVVVMVMVMVMALLLSLLSRRSRQKKDTFERVFCRIGLMSRGVYISKAENTGRLSMKARLDIKS